MPLFARRHHGSSAHNHGITGPSHHHQRQGGWFGRKDPAKVVAGLKASLANPHTTHEGREGAKHQLHQMGVSTHVPFMTKVKRTLGIRSSPRRNVNHSQRRGLFY